MIREHARFSRTLTLREIDPEVGTLEDPNEGDPEVETLEDPDGDNMKCEWWSQ